MRTTHLLVALAAGTLAFQLWRDGGLPDPVPADISENGFVALPLPSGVSDADLVIFAPANCPKAAGRRADLLEEELDRLGIRHKRSQRADFAGLEPGDVPLVQSVMNGELPIVFVSGRAKANPSPDEVAAEYAAGHAD